MRPSFEYDDGMTTYNDSGDDGIFSHDGEGSHWYHWKAGGWDQTRKETLIELVGLPPGKHFDHHPDDDLDPDDDPCGDDLDPDDDPGDGNDNYGGEYEGSQS